MSRSPPIIFIFIVWMMRRPMNEFLHFYLCFLWKMIPTFKRIRGRAKRWRKSMRLWMRNNLHRKSGLSLFNGVPWVFPLCEPLHGEILLRMKMSWIVERFLWKRRRLLLRLLLWRLPLRHLAPCVLALWIWHLVPPQPQCVPALWIPLQMRSPMHLMPLMPL